jgi:hypothetical protein
VQDQPVVRVAQQLGRAFPYQPVLHLARGLPRCQAGAVADAEDVGVHRHGAFAEGDVQHDIGGLAANPRQRFQRRTFLRHLPAMPFHQLLCQGGEVPRLALPQPDGADIGRDALGPQRRHGRWRRRRPEQRRRRLVHRGVGRLG